MDIYINCMHCNHSNLLSDWILTGPAFQIGVPAQLGTLMELRRGSKLRPLEQCSVICPCCKEKTSVALHDQFSEIKARVDAAGVASDMLFKEVREE